LFTVGGCRALVAQAWWSKAYRRSICKPRLTIAQFVTQAGGLRLTIAQFASLLIGMKYEVQCAVFQGGVLQSLSRKEDLRGMGNPSSCAGYLVYQCLVAEAWDMALTKANFGVSHLIMIRGQCVESGFQDGLVEDASILWMP